MKLKLIEWIQKLLINTGVFIKFKDAFFSHPAEPLFRIKAILARQKGNSLTIIDIGAADGMVSYYFSKEFPSAKIIGFEPNPEEFKKAVEVNRTNTNVEIRNLALSSSTGSGEMHILDNSFSSSMLEPEVKDQSDGMSEKLRVKKTIPVRISTLDSEINTGKVDLIKIDTQGTELEILKGAAELLKVTEYILIEQNNNDYYKNGCQYFQIDAFLREKGFELFDIITTYRTNNQIKEFDAIYRKAK